MRAAAQELENAVAAPEAAVRQQPFADKWNMAEVVDHIAQTQIRAAEELRHLMAGRRPPGPPVYEGLRSAAAAWAPWAELVDGLRATNRELVALLESPPADGADGPTERTILVVNRTLPDGRVTPQIFVAELGWKEYALVQGCICWSTGTKSRSLWRRWRGARESSRRSPQMARGPALQETY